MMIEMALLVCLGGLCSVNPSKQSKFHDSPSEKITTPLANFILAQSHEHSQQVKANLIRAKKSIPVKRLQTNKTALEISEKLPATLQKSFEDFNRLLGKR